jgi:ureidoacrylate peracid hydrolase
MHTIAIDPSIQARGRALRGRDHVFADLDLARTAHVVVDLQVGFMAEGAPVEVPVAREIVPNVNAISKAVRGGGGICAFLRYTYDPDEKLQWTAWYDAMVSPSERDKMSMSFAPDNPNFALWSELDVQPQDLVVNKTRFSAFIPGTCDLHALLQARGIDTLILTGTLTNCCCESTARDAQQMNYKIIFMADGNAALTDAEHNATLCSMAAIFADVMTTDELLAAIVASRAELKAVA